MKTSLVFICLLVTAYAQRDRDCSWMKRQLGNNNLKRSVYTSEEDTIHRIYPYSRALETLVNYQIKKEMYAFYSYLSMSHFFEREDHCMEGFAKYFHDAALEELEHAEKFMKYQAKRGGRVKLYDLPAPTKQAWSNGYHAFKAALTLEKNVTDEILCLHQLASHEYHDVDFINFLEGEIIPEQYTGMKELTQHIKSLIRMSSAKGKDDFLNYGIAEALYDKQLKA